MSDPFPPAGTPGLGQPPAPPSTDGKATASLILGICSLFLWLCPFVGLAAAITGLVLGIKSRNRHVNGMATAGIVLCIIGGLASLVNGAVGAYLGATGEHPLVSQF